MIHHSTRWMTFRSDSVKMRKGSAFLPALSAAMPMTAATGVRPAMTRASSMAARQFATTASIVDRGRTSPPTGALEIDLEGVTFDYGDDALADAEALLQDTLEFLPQAVAHIEAHGRLIRFNARFRQLVGSAIHGHVDALRYKLNRAIRSRELAAAGVHAAK